MAMSSTKTIRDITFGVPLINTRGACRPSLHIGCRFNGYISIITSRDHTLESMQYCILISYLKKTSSEEITFSDIYCQFQLRTLLRFSDPFF